MTKAHAGGVNAAAARKADSFTVGAIHNLSKRTSFFGGYQHVYLDNPNAAAANDLSNVRQRCQLHGTELCAGWQQS